MTPKEKAKELVDKYWYELQDVDHSYTRAKYCALITVDEMINYLVSSLITGTLMTYWQEVKQAIESL